LKGEVRHCTHTSKPQITAQIVLSKIRNPQLTDSPTGVVLGKIGLPSNYVFLAVDDYWAESFSCIQRAPLLPAPKRLSYSLPFVMCFVLNLLFVLVTIRNDLLYRFCPDLEEYSFQLAYCVHSQCVLFVSENATLCRHHRQIRSDHKQTVTRPFKVVVIWEPRLGGDTIAKTLGVRTCGVGHHHHGRKMLFAMILVKSCPNY